jgi:hypothetical protein
MQYWNSVKSFLALYLMNQNSFYLKCSFQYTKMCWYFRSLRNHNKQLSINLTCISPSHVTPPSLQYGDSHSFTFSSFNFSLICIRIPSVFKSLFMMLAAFLEKKIYKLLHNPYNLAVSYQLMSSASAYSSQPKPPIARSRLENELYLARRQNAVIYTCIPRSSY